MLWFAPLEMLEEKNRQPTDPQQDADKPRLVKPPKDFSPPHPWQTCPCDVCATRREFQK